MTDVRLPGERPAIWVRVGQNLTGGRVPAFGRRIQVIGHRFLSGHASDDEIQPRDYYSALAERYPWADSTQVRKGASFLETSLREITDLQLTNATRKIDWAGLRSIGNQLGTLLGPVPEIPSR